MCLLRWPMRACPVASRWESAVTLSIGATHAARLRRDARRSPLAHERLSRRLGRRVSRQDTNEDAAQWARACTQAPPGQLPARAPPRQFRQQHRRPHRACGSSMLRPCALRIFRPCSYPAEHQPRSVAGCLERLVTAHRLRPSRFCAGRSILPRRSRPASRNPSLSGHPFSSTVVRSYRLHAEERPSGWRQLPDNGAIYLGTCAPSYWPRCRHVCVASRCCPPRSSGGVPRHRRAVPGAAWKRCFAVIRLIPLVVNKCQKCRLH